MKLNGIVYLSLVIFLTHSFIYHNPTFKNLNNPIDFDEDISVQNINDFDKSSELKKKRVLSEMTFNQNSIFTPTTSSVTLTSSLFKRPERNLKDNAELEILSLESDMKQLGSFLNNENLETSNSDDGLLSFGKISEGKNSNLFYDSFNHA